MKTTITRTSEIAFIKTLTNEKGGSFSITILKGSTDYSNACSLFHKENIEIALGNYITYYIN